MIAAGRKGAAALPLHWTEVSSAATECHRAPLPGGRGDYLVLRARLIPAAPYLARQTVGFHQVERAPRSFATLTAAHPGGAKRTAWVGGADHLHAQV